MSVLMRILSISVDENTRSLTGRIEVSLKRSGVSCQVVANLLFTLVCHNILVTRERIL